jgi:hypothetical protein
MTAKFTEFEVMYENEYGNNCYVGTLHSLDAVRILISAVDEISASPRVTIVCVRKEMVLP